MMDVRMDIAVSPLNGRSPVAISYSITPSENTSLRCIDVLAFRLLRRHVGDRAQDPSLAGECARGADGLLSELRLVAQLGEPEIEHLHPTVVR